MQAQRACIFSAFREIQAGEGKAVKPRFPPRGGAGGAPEFERGAYPPCREGALQRVLKNLTKNVKEGIYILRSSAIMADVYLKL